MSAIERFSLLLEAIFITLSLIGLVWFVFSIKSRKR